MRQLLIETIAQSLAAVALGMVFAYWSLELIRSNFPPAVLKYVPGINIMSLDWPTFVYSFAGALIAGTLAGLLPALHVSRPKLNESLREGARGASAGRARHRMRSTLVVGEVALALVLLVGAGLMINGVAIIGEKFARKYWPGESPLGKRIKLGDDASNNPWLTIVGIVGDVRYDWFECDPAPVIYLPYRQAARQIMQFAVRVPGNPLSFAQAVRKQVGRWTRTCRFSTSRPKRA